VRRVIGILLVSSISAVSSAAAGDELVMPFDCGLKAGRVTVSPSAQKHYPIVGERERQSITTCHGPAACRTLTVHRFVISCGGAGVEWMRVAAAIKSAGDRPAWIDGGHLNLVLPARGSRSALRPCNDRPAFALGDMPVQRVAFASGCASGPRSGDFERIVLPPGFAPVGELGARLVASFASGPSKSGNLINAASLRSVSATTGETLVAKADTDSIVEPIRGLEPYEPALEPTIAADDWVTVVRAEPPLAAAAPREAPSPAPLPWAWMLLGMALATTAGLARMRFAHSSLQLATAGALRPTLRSEPWLRLRWSLRGSAPIRKFTNAGAAVTALLEQTGEIVEELRGAGPLREVLQSELALVRQRLAAVDAAAGENADASAKNAPQFRALVRELDRIRRIASSAAASLARTRPAGKLPATVCEAYHVLGVNPDVSEDVAKKIVDALRMSWHPDHARDKSDQAERENRIRQINVAWELITAKRAAA
jgi:DnaJ domain